MTALRQRPRQHGPVLGPPARRELERRGWRTTVEYVENHRRSLDGRLLGVESHWIACAEHQLDPSCVVSARADQPSSAWAELLANVAGQASPSAGSSGAAVA